MADYAAMYYTLLRACERAIKQLELMHPETFLLLRENGFDYNEAYHALIDRSHRILSQLTEAEQQSEDIYIQTCDPNGEPEDALIDEWLQQPFSPPPHTL